MVICVQDCEAATLLVHQLQQISPGRHIVRFHVRFDYLPENGFVVSKQSDRYFCMVERSADVFHIHSFWVT